MDDDWCVSNPPDDRKQTQRNVNYRVLVDEYPAHEFIIDLSEAESLGLSVCEPTEQVSDLFDELRPYLDSPTTRGLTTYVGLVSDEEVKPRVDVVPQDSAGG